MPLPATPDQTDYINTLDQIRAGSNVPQDVATATNVANLVSAYPGLTPGVLTALSQAGIGPGPQAEAVWQKALAATAAQPTPGQVVHVKPQHQTSSGGSGSFLDYIPVVGAVKGALEGKSVGEVITRAIPGGKFAETARNSILPEAEKVISQGANTYTSGGAVNPVKDITGQDPSTLLPNPKDVTRTLGTAAQGPYEQTIGTLRSALSNPLQPTPETLAQGFQQTTAAQTQQGLSSGQGFLPNWNSPAMQAQAEQARLASPYLIGGQAWTIGRAAANVVLTPGTEAFKTFSGALDAGAALTLDPVARATAGFADTLQEANKFDTAEELARRSTFTAPEEVNRLTLNQARKGTLSASELADLGAVNSNGERTVLPGSYDAWGQTAQGQTWRNGAAAETSPFVLSHAYGIPDVTLANAVAKVSTPEEVDNLVRDTLGRADATQPSYNPILQSRALTPVPAATWPTSRDGDMNVLAEQVDRWLVNARMSDATRETAWNRIADVTNQPDKYAAANAAIDAVGDALVEKGYTRDQANAALRQERANIVGTIQYGADSQGLPLINGFLQTADDTHPIPHQLWDSQTLNSNIIPPDYRQVRAMMSPLGSLINNQATQGAIGAGDWLMQGWRRIQILHMAATVRALADSQLAIASEGGSAIFNHPLNQIGYILGNPDSRIINAMEDWATTHTASGRALQQLQEARASGSTLESLAGSEGAPDLSDLEAQAAGAHRITGRLRQIEATFGRGGITPTGENPATFAARLNALYGDGITRPFSALLDQNLKQYSHGFTMIPATSEHGPQVLAEELARLHEESLARGLLAADTPEDAKNAFWGQGRSSLEEAGGQYEPGSLEQSRLYQAQDPRMSPLATIRPAADRQVELLYEDLNRVHANNPALMDAIKTGHIGDVPLTDTWGHDVNPAARDALADIIADPNQSSPALVRARQLYTLPPNLSDAKLKVFNAGVQYMMEALIPRPLNYLARGPFNAELMWSHAEKLFSELGPEDRAAMIQHAQEANMGGGPISIIARTLFGDGAGDWTARHSSANLVQRLVDQDARIADLPGHQPTLTLEQLNDIAMQRAATDTTKTLYTLNEKSQFADSARLIFPFMPVWQNTVARWAHLAYQNPEIIRRAQQGWMGLTAPGSDTINTLSGNSPMGGFIHTNGFGDKVIAYPGSQLATQFMTSLGGGPGVPVPLTGTVQGMSAMFAGLPGVGPAAQVPLAWMLPDKPQWDQVSQLLFPNGRPSSDPFTAAGNSLLPAWARRLSTFTKSPDSDREFAGAVMDAATQLNSQGGYNLNGPNARSEMNRLLNDAKSSAKMIYLLRAAGSFALPSSPQSDWLATDKSGNLTAQWRMSKWFYDNANKVGYDKALTEYFNKFGLNNYLLVQPHTQANKAEGSTIQGLDRLMTADGSTFERKNPDLAQKYPITFGLFAPSSGGYDQAAYNRQFANGQRSALTPAQMLSLANNRLAQWAFAYTKNQLPVLGPNATPADKAARQVDITNLRTDLRTNFPGYAPGAGSTDPVTVFNELYRASEDPKIRATQAGRALNLYLEDRNSALDSQAAAGLATDRISTAAAAAPIRAWLNDQGTALLQKYPQFQALWDSALYSEVRP